MGFESLSDVSAPSDFHWAASKRNIHFEWIDAGDVLSIQCEHPFVAFLIFEFESSFKYIRVGMSGVLVVDL